MAYVVARRNGRFEVRESLHTPDGPRARSLAGFHVLTDEVIARAKQQARRPFHTEAVTASARRAGAPVAMGGTPGATRLVGAKRGSGGVRGLDGSAGRFVEASRRMAASLQRRPAPGAHAGSPARTDPGMALIDLLGFADAVTASQPSRPFERLAFPALVRLVKHPLPASSSPR